MKILITGCSGYIGSCLSNYLKIKGKIYFLDKDRPRSFTNIKKNFFKCNLNNLKNTERVIRKIRPDVVIHLAAKSTVNHKIKKSSYILNNIKATKNLIKAMNKFDVNKIIFSSTAAVYNENKKLIKENDYLKPISNYGKTKIIEEKEIIKNKKINFIFLRFFNVAGSLTNSSIGEFHNPETHLIPISVFSALKNKSINIFGSNYKTSDGTCIRDYVHVKDICSAIEKSIFYFKKKKSLVVNIGSGKGTSNEDDKSEQDDKKEQSAKDETESSIDSDYDIDEFNLDDQLSEIDQNEQNSEQIIQKSSKELNLDYKIFTNEFDETPCVVGCYGSRYVFQFQF